MLVARRDHTKSAPKPSHNRCNASVRYTLTHLTLVIHLAQMCTDKTAHARNRPLSLGIRFMANDDLLHELFAHQVAHAPGMHD
jgi:hypothetical protein